MKSNIGFLQVLVLILVVLNALNLYQINVFLMVFMIIVAWTDSYIKLENNNRRLD